MKIDNVGMIHANLIVGALLLAAVAVAYYAKVKAQKSYRTFVALLVSALGAVGVLSLVVGTSGAVQNALWGDLIATCLIFATVATTAVAYMGGYFRRTTVRKSVAKTGRSK